MTVRIIKQGAHWAVISAASGVLLIGDFDSYQDAYNTCTLMHWMVVE